MLRVVCSILIGFCILSAFVNTGIVGGMIVCGVVGAFILVSR